MDRLYAPWRFEYVTEDKIEGCVFCHIYNNPEDDEKLGMIFRDKNCYVVMNNTVQICCNNNCVTLYCTTIHCNVIKCTDVL